jgi:hypothetical protein
MIDARCVGDLKRMSRSDLQAYIKQETGPMFFRSFGEARRQAQLLRAARAELKRRHYAKA